MEPAKISIADVVNELAGIAGIAAAAPHWRN
jgi:hypothetical protein